MVCSRAFVLLLVSTVAVAWLCQVSARPQPNLFNNIKKKVVKGVKVVVGKVADQLRPYTSCLSDCGMGNAAFSYFQNCGSSAMYGPGFLAVCMLSANAPGDVKGLAQQCMPCARS